MKVLITGAAGFIGFHLTKAMLNQGDEIIGIDNINDYYDVNLKYGRLKEAGIETSAIQWHQKVSSATFPNYHFIRMNLEDKNELMDLCKNEKFDVIVNLAAQAGVRYSIQNPDAYVQSNVVGFLNILEASRHNQVKHLVYASSSSVYGLNDKMPFHVKDNVDHPISLYAATKKSNELMAHAYSHLFQIPTSGLRFFTVYGAWGRPDMAYFLFADAITAGKPIKVFNHGKMKRDFTFIDDIVQGIINVKNKPPQTPVPYQLFNIGNNDPIELMSFIEEIEHQLDKKAVMEMNEMQPGDVVATWADVDELIENFNYKPTTTIKEGLASFVKWYKTYYNIN